MELLAEVSSDENHPIFDFSKLFVILNWEQYSDEVFCARLGSLKIRKSKILTIIRVFLRPLPSAISEKNPKYINIFALRIVSENMLGDGPALWIFPGFTD